MPSTALAATTAHTVGDSASSAPPATSRNTPERVSTRNCRVRSEYRPSHTAVSSGTRAYAAVVNPIVIESACRASSL